MRSFRCVSCSHELESDALDPTCDACGSPVIVTGAKVRSLESSSFDALPPGVWRFKALITSLGASEPVTLGEGGTPLLSAVRLGGELGLSKLFVKDESRNPTGSFIDRGCTVLVSLAKERGVEECRCSTTGNLGASLAAYCAKAGIRSEITVKPTVDRGKLYQMIAFGARIETRQRRAADSEGSGRAISVNAGNPFILEGEKTTCFEVVQDLKWASPDVILVPVGTGGHLSMFSRGLEQLRSAGLCDGTGCRLVGVQFGGSAGRGSPRRRDASSDEPDLATELAESEPILWEEARRAVRASGGDWIEATASDTIAATSLLARTEGIFAEPAAASVVASLRLAKSERVVDADETVVCVITGAGLKDTKAISRIARAARQVVAPEDYLVARMQVGDTKVLILKSLAGKPRFGYELWKLLSERKELSTASVYQHLGELVDMGLVRETGVTRFKGRERIFYELTKRGADLLRTAVSINRKGRY